jgi:hypothetical protein
MAHGNPWRRNAAAKTGCDRSIVGGTIRTSIK